MIGKENSSERGQAIVLLVLAMIVLLGFTALAIDGSMVYSDRRFAQNAADASSLAGGAAAAAALEAGHITWKNWPCNSSTPVTPTGTLATAKTNAEGAAIKRAGDNGFTIDKDTANDADTSINTGSVNVTCATQGTGAAKDKFMDIHTWVNMNTQTTFAHFVFGGLMRNSVEAVTRVRPRQPLAAGHAIVALNTANCLGQKTGVQLHGTIFADVEGGGIWSNGCLSYDGNSPSSCNDTPVKVTGGDVTYVGQLSIGNPPNVLFVCDHDGNTIPFNQSPSVMPSDLYTVDFDPAQCGQNLSGDKVYDVNGSDLDGNYGGDGIMDPGLYCVTGDINIHASDVLSGTGITIYLTGNYGITINGGAQVNWKALESYDPNSPAIAGLLIYAPFSTGTNNVFQIAGNAASTFQGTILAPKADIDYMGTENSDGNKAQIIGWNVEMGGTSDLYIDYQGDITYNKPTAMDLYK